jgi:O-antigen ligase
VRGFSRLVVVALAWGALTAGARYPWAYWPLAVGCALLGVWSIRANQSWRRPEWRILALALSVVAVAIAIQAVPLPAGVVYRLSPAAPEFLRLYEIGYATHPPAWQTLSIGPTATWTALVLFAAFSIFLLGLIDAFGRVPLERFVVRLMVLGVAMAVFGVVQRAASGTEPYVYGVWKAPPLSTPFGPFFNRNHFAGWMLMALSLALGYATAALRASDPPTHGGPTAWLRWTSTPDASRFMVAAFAVFAMAASLVVTGSRSGIVAFGIATVVFGVMVVLHAPGRRARHAVAGGMVILFAGAVAWAGAQSTLMRFSLASSDLQGRVAAWRDTVRIAGDFAVTGTGLGTYDRAMIVYQTGDRIAFFAQAHNDFLQVLAEGGALVSVPALAAAVVIAVLARRRLRGAVGGATRGNRARGDMPSDVVSRWLRAGALAGIVGIAAQSMVEYSLQRAGNAALCVVLLGLVLHRPRDVRPSESGS